jgi:murein DD-endopeptidase MepM/ murein hydrolase activator NlpD
MRRHPKASLVPALIAAILAGCSKEPAAPKGKPFDAAFVRLSPWEIAALPLATRFDPPMGGERGALTYNAQPFRTTRHLGDDLNGIGGWNSDLGDPVYAAGAGQVIYAGVPGPGWGNMLILAHRVPERSSPTGWRVYETVYAHMEKMLVSTGAVVQRGQQIGKVGTANGRYFAHLHFEVRHSSSVYPGPGYSDGPLDRVSPTAFVESHGGASNDPILPAP